jgi:hypothetical protein
VEGGVGEVQRKRVDDGPIGIRGGWTHPESWRPDCSDDEYLGGLGVSASCPR